MLLLCVPPNFRTMTTWWWKVLSKTTCESNYSFLSVSSSTGSHRSLNFTRAQSRDVCLKSVFSAHRVLLNIIHIRMTSVGWSIPLQCWNIQRYFREIMINSRYPHQVRRSVHDRKLRIFYMLHSMDVKVTKENTSNTKSEPTCTWRSVLALWNRYLFFRQIISALISVHLCFVSYNTSGKLLSSRKDISCDHL